MQQPKENRPYLRSRFRARIRALLEESYIFILCIAVSAVIIAIIALVFAVIQTNYVITDMTQEIRSYRKATLAINSNTDKAMREVARLAYQNNKTQEQVANLHVIQSSILQRLAALEGQRQKVPP